MLRKMRSLMTLSILFALALTSTSCSKLGAGRITGPGGPDVNQLQQLQFSGRYSAANRPAQLLHARTVSRTGVSMVVNPMAGDSVYVYGTLADITPGGFDWQAVRFWGLYNEDGTIDRPFQRLVAATGETYTFLPVVHRPDGMRIPLIGLWTVNDQAVTAVDHSIYGDMFTFGVSRDNAGQPLILTLRNDFEQYAWYELVTNGVEPDSVQYSQPVHGGLEMGFFATHTKLWSMPMIYDEAQQAWIQYVWAKRGSTVIFHPHTGTGNLWLAGNFLKDGSGNQTLCTNIVDIDEDPTNTYYPVFIAELGEDGTWSMPNPDVDNRWTGIILN